MKKADVVRNFTKNVMSKDWIDYLNGYYGCEGQWEYDVFSSSSKFEDKCMWSEHGIWAEHFNYKLTRKMIEDALLSFIDKHYKWYSMNRNLTREQCKALFAITYPEIWCDVDCEYGIGRNRYRGWNKSLKKERELAEEIWKSNKR